MNRFLALLILATCFAAASNQAMAQNAAGVLTADDQFHSGAKQYIANELEPAAQAVEAGLSLEPDNAQLLELKQLIEAAQQEKEQQQQEQQQQGSEDQEEESSDDQQQGDQEQQENEGDQSEQEQQEGDEQQDEGEQSQEEQQEAGGDQEQQNEGEGEGTSEPEQEEVDPNQLSREEAERILQAMEIEEGQLLREVQKMKTRPRRVEKDW